MKRSIIIYLMSSITLFGDIFHYQHLEQGDQATFLGGAYTALSKDSAGMYNNPAGFIYTNDSISASVQAYSYWKLTYKEANHETGEDYSKVSQGVVPTMFSYTFDKKVLGGKVGFSFLTEDSISVNQNDNSKAEISQKVNLPDHSELSMLHNYSVLNGGLTYSRMLSDNLSFGLTLYGVYRSNQYINKQFIDWTLRDGRVFNYTDSLYSEDKQYGLKPIIGILYSKNNHSFGISLSQEMIIHRNYNYIYSRYQQTYSLYETIKSDDSPESPFNINLGYSYEDISNIFSFDIKYHSATNQITKGKLETIKNSFQGKESDTYIYTGETPLPTFDIETSDVVNFAIGYSKKFSKYRRLNMGFFTNMSKVSEETIKEQDKDGDSRYMDGESVDMVGGTLSYSFPLSNKMMTLGVLYSYGEGIASYGNLALLGSKFNNYLDVEQQQIVVFLNMVEWKNR